MRERYHRFSPQERLEFIHEYLDMSNDITLSEFCNKHELNRTTFTGWLNKYEQKLGADSPNRRGFADITEELNNRVQAISGCNTPVICSSGLMEPAPEVQPIFSGIRANASPDNVIATLSNGTNITFHISNLRQILEVLK